MGHSYSGFHGPFILMDFMSHLF